MDQDELIEQYTLKFKSINGISEHCFSTENSFETSFQGESFQGVIDNIFDFLKQAGYTYLGHMTITSKDGQKEWKTNGTQP